MRIIKRALLWLWRGAETAGALWPVPNADASGAIRAETGRRERDT